MLKKEPFVSYTTDEERQVKPKRDVFSISLNPKERALLDKFKEEINCPHDSKALKLLAVAGANVINATLGATILKYLSSKDRTKILD
jgi:hypothetical protein